MVWLESYAVWAFSTFLQWQMSNRLQCKALRNALIWMEISVRRTTGTARGTDWPECGKDLTKWLAAIHRTYGRTISRTAPPNHSPARGRDRRDVWKTTTKYKTCVDHIIWQEMEMLPLDPTVSYPRSLFPRFPTRLRRWRISAHTPSNSYFNFSIFGWRTHIASNGTSWVKDAQSTLVNLT